MLDRCDKCENMARIRVTGAVPHANLCARHAAALCESVGDATGAAKFTALIEGDREGVSA